MAVQNLSSPPKKRSERFDEWLAALFRYVKSNERTAFLVGGSAGTGIGYTTGSGGTVTQLTNKGTGVTINALCGQITMNNAALAAGAKAAFIVNNSKVSVTDGAVVWVASGGTANAYRADVTAVTAGSFTITVENITAGSLSEAPVIGFAVIKAVTS